MAHNRPTRSHQFYVLLDNDIIGFGEREEDRIAPVILKRRLVLPAPNNNVRCLTMRSASWQVAASGARRIGH
jgi:hypothetical protein